MIEEKEVRSLIEGQQFAGEFYGVSYKIGVIWTSDWCVSVDLISFKPLLSSHTYFWLNKMPEEIAEEYLYDSIYKLPEVVAFKKRIDAMREVDQDALESIIEKLEHEE